MITLAPNAVQTTTVGGTVIDATTAAVVSSVMTNFLNLSFNFGISFGTMDTTGLIFTPSPYAAQQAIFIDLVAGTYRVGNTPAQPLPAPALANMIAVVTTHRNNMETLAQLAGAAPGVITPWPV